jgi:hypothetical protein
MRWLCKMGAGNEGITSRTVVCLRLSFVTVTMNVVTRVFCGNGHDDLQRRQSSSVPWNAFLEVCFRSTVNAPRIAREVRGRNDDERV